MSIRKLKPLISFIARQKANYVEAINESFSKKLEYWLKNRKTKVGSFNFLLLKILIYCKIQ